ncbi:MAG TPA: efflux transporter outer membrane subunit [Caulobacteraceae bacterium]|jgi:NodT family efflux transporter outer membrane factor (OMF) lipoprotein|nr:efflux transporter outer membrane subunit [Caulobacteraceae bacterium]
MPSPIKRSRPWLAALLAASALTACAEVGPNFTRPQTPNVSGYAMKGDVASARIVDAAGAEQQGAWWKAFNSPELDATIRLALDNNKTLSEADATLRQLKASEAAVRGTLGPQADANAGLQRERINVAAFGFTGFPNPTITLYSIGGAVSYDLDLFGGGKRSLEGARARAEAQANRADAAYLTISGNVALEAMQVAGVRAQIAAVQSMVDDDQKNLELVRKAAQLGGEANMASTTAQTQVDQDLALLPPLQQQLAQHRHALALLVGKAPADYTPPDFDFGKIALPGAIPVEVPSELIRRRPDILAAEADLHAATAQIGVETAKLYPDIKLNAALTQSSLTPGKLFSYDSSGWNFGPSLSLPIFHGGTLKANRNAAAAAAQAANARYQETVLNAFVQVADVLQALAHDDDEVRAEAKAMGTSETNVNDERLAYREGAGTILRVLDAQRQFHIARRNYAAAVAQRYSDVVRLYVAIAADWHEAESPQPTAS